MTLGSVLKKIKQSSDEKKNEQAKKQKGIQLKLTKKNVFVLVLCFAILAVALVFFYNELNEKPEKSAIELSVNAGSAKSTVSKELIGLFIADMNYQLGSYIPKDDKYDETIRMYASANATILLQAEYYNDYIYGLGLDESQQKSIDNAINKLIEKYGSEEKLNEYLLNFGADKDALKRYFEMSLKQSNVLDYIAMNVTDDEMKDYFADNYMVVDAVVVPIGGYKDNNKTQLLPVDEEKRAEAYSLCESIKNGEMTFEEAHSIYGEGDYKTYFVSMNNAEGLHTAVFERLMGMSAGQTGIAETETACWIVRRKNPDSEMFRNNTDLMRSIRVVVRDNNFGLVCETLSDYVTVNEDVINGLVPSDIGSIDMSSLAAIS